MTIVRLDLIAFGPFTDDALDLANGVGGVHLIYGPNEAGKSSALRALWQMLYGIPVNSADDFIHSYQKLRIGVWIQNSDGSVLKCIRRKGNKNTLRGADDQTVLDEGQLTRCLGAVDQSVFRTMFGIDHNTLVQGGQAIVQGGGEIGQALFVAGTGIADLRAVQRKLEAEAEGLFRPRGSSPAINQTVSRLNAARQKRRAAALPTSQWSTHDKALRDALEKLEGVGRELDQAQGDKSRLQRMRQALPAVAKRAELLDRLHSADVILAQAEVIKDLHLRLGSHQKAMSDRSNCLSPELRQFESDASAILRDLRPDLQVTQAEQLRLKVAERVKIQNLANEHLGRVTNCKNAKQTVDGVIQQIDTTNRKLSQFEAPRDPGSLQRAVQRAQNRGELEEQLSTSREQVRLAEEQASIDLRKLTLWSGRLEQLEQLAVPEMETIDRLERDTNNAEKAVEKHTEKITELANEHRELEAQIEELSLQGQVPAEEDLALARRKRDQGWRLVRSAWMEGRDDSEDARGFVGDLAPGEDLARAFERSVENADELADRLRREAEKIAKKSTLLAASNRCSAHVEQEKTKQSLAEARRDGILASWSALWQPLGIRALSPQEMRAWIQRQRHLAVNAQTIRELRTKLRQLGEEIGRHRAELSQCLQGLGERGDTPDETLVTMLDRCVVLIDCVKTSASDRELFQRDLDDLKQEKLPAAQLIETEAEQELEKWNRDWGSAVRRLGLPENATPAEANSVIERLKDLFDKLDKAASHRQRIQAIDDDAATFSKDVRDLAERVAPDLSQAPCEQAAAELHDRLERAGQVKQLEEQLLNLSAGASVASFVTEVQAEHVDTLDARIESLSQQIRVLQERRDTLRDTITTERNFLSACAGQADAAEAAEDFESLLAQIQSQVEEYSRLWLARAVLRSAVELYRERNQGPVLERASELFRGLTLDSFEGLRADYNDKGEPVLVGVRSGGRKTVSVYPGMSDGTADQLYLALRLASLEQHLRNHEPLPFIVDDILISFDNDRAVAALRTLAEFSQRTQVIFFTHHEHLVELAQGSLDSNVLFVHTLHARGRRLSPFS